MPNEIKYLPMEPGQEIQIFNLIVTVFGELVAPYFLEQGRDEFLKYIDPKALTERSKSNPLNIVAIQNQNPIGYIEFLSLLFIPIKLYKGSFPPCLFLIIRLEEIES